MTGPGELPRLPAPPRFPPFTFGGTRPAGGSGIFTISVHVWCRGLPLANLLLLRSQALEVHVSDRRWAWSLHLHLQRHVALEKQFVVHFGKMLQKYTKMMLWQNKITAALRKEASELQYHLKVVDDFWKQPFLQPKASRASLGVALDLTGLGDVQKAIGLFIANVVAGWASDASYLAKLVTS